MRWLVLAAAACSSSQRAEPIASRVAIDAAIDAPIDAASRDALATTLLPADAAPTIVVTTTHECGWIMDRIYFPAGSAAISAQSRPVVDEMAAMFACGMRVEGITKIEVAGHADDKERDPLRLSEERAVAIANAFAAKGVPATAMVVVGYGATQPTDQRKTEDARARNRRVEFLVLERKPD